MKTRKVPSIKKTYRMDIWTIRAIYMTMLREGLTSETQIVRRVIKQVLKHKKCPHAKKYRVDRKKKIMDVFCDELDNWVDARKICLGNCLLEEYKKIGVF